MAELFGSIIDVTKVFHQNNHGCFQFFSEKKQFVQCSCGSTFWKIDDNGEVVCIECKYKYGTIYSQKKEKPEERLLCLCGETVWSIEKDFIVCLMCGKRFHIEVVNTFSYDVPVVMKEEMKRNLKE